MPENFKFYKLQHIFYELQHPFYKLQHFNQTTAHKVNQHNFLENISAEAV